jgi:hypothetical protein
MAYIRQPDVSKVKNLFFKTLFDEFNSVFGKDNVQKHFYYPENYDFEKGLVKKLQIKISKSLDLSNIKSKGSIAPYVSKIKRLSSSSGIDIDLGQKAKIQIYITGGKNGSGKLPIKGEVTKSPKTAQQESATIYFLEQYLNKKSPTLAEINEYIKFEFDQDYYNSFIEQTNVLAKTKYLTNKSRIFLDSAKGDHDFIFTAFKKLGYRDQKDNWNPADIWIFNTDTKTIKDRLTNAKSIPEFNDILKKLFNDNHLIGISLKKISGKGKGEIVDPSKRNPIEFNLKKITHKPGQANFMIESKEGFIIRAGFKAGAGKVYYEGRMQGAKVQLGAISKIFIAEYVNGKIKKDILKLEDDWKKSEASVEIKNQILLSESVKIIESIIKTDKRFLVEMYYASMKQTKDSSIYYKVY